MNAVQLQSVMDPSNRSAGARVARGALGTLTPAYRLAVAVRNALFDAGRRGIARLPKPVISIGNLTTGGTGKTPMTIHLARHLAAMGRHPAVLLRGYHSTGGFSDEDALLVDELGTTASVHSSPDRVAGALRATAQNHDTDVFLLDDGFQHRQVARDLDIVLIDATNPFGFDRLLPRGLLREPKSNLRRADAVIVTRADQVAPEALAQLDRRIETLSRRRPVAHTAHRWTGYVDQADKTWPVDLLSSARVGGVCGIGNPAAFSRSLTQHTAQTVATRWLDDHHTYSADELRLMFDTLSKHDPPDAIVTTGKDWVKWRRLIDPAELPVPVYRPVLEIAMLDGANALDELLQKTLSQSGSLTSQDPLAGTSG